MSIPARCLHLPLRISRLRTPRWHASSKSSLNTRRFSSQHPGSTAASAQTAGASTSPPAKGLAALRELTDELDGIAPRFEIDGGDVEILHGPKEFYAALKEKIARAKRRIYLSTLYIGKTEDELIASIRTALQRNPDLEVAFLTDALRGTRESPNASCASLLAPLVAEFGPRRVQVRMFHTPNLTGVRKAVLPKRINEGWGLQHMKLYGVDDEIIMSGANLSDDYFTNRQDRYHVFHSKALTGYYEKIHDTVSSISFDIQPDSKTQAGYTMDWPKTNPVCSPLDEPLQYIHDSSILLGSLINPQPAAVKARRTTPPKTNTFVYPIFQLEPILQEVITSAILAQTSVIDPRTAPKIARSTEVPAMTSLLQKLTKPPFSPTTLTFTAGYFNPSPFLTSLLLATLAPPPLPAPSRSRQPLAPPASTPSHRPHLTVIAASPYANGFYGSTGVSGMLPAAYTLLCKRFLEAVHKRGLVSSRSKPDAPNLLTLLEWRRGLGRASPTASHPTPPNPDTNSKSPQQSTTQASPTAAAPKRAPAEEEAEEEDEEPGWTYHAKGIWATLPSESGLGPFATVVGSSNYTTRSASLDLEANALVVTRDPALQRRLHAEIAHLARHGRELTLDDYRRTERRVGWHVRLSMWIVKAVGGAL